MSSCHVVSCHVVTLKTDSCVCPCQYSPTHVKDQNPCLCVKRPFQGSRPHSCSVGLVKVWWKNPQNAKIQAKHSATPPFLAWKHVGSDKSNMSFHDVMSRHVVMSCHVVTLETDLCVCPCQYSPTHVKYQNPCLFLKRPFQGSRPHSCSFLA